MIRNIDIHVQIPGFSRTSIKIPGGNPYFQIPGLSRFSRTCANPVIFKIITENVKLLVDTMILSIEAMILLLYSYNNYRPV